MTITNLEELREIIIKAKHPNIESLEEIYKIEIENAGWDYEEQKDLAEHSVFNYLVKFGLADVLIALKDYCSFCYYRTTSNVIELHLSSGLNLEAAVQHRLIWNLDLDLNSQGPETILRLLKLLKGE